MHDDMTRTLTVLLKKQATCYPSQFAFKDWISNFFFSFLKGSFNISNSIWNSVILFLCDFYLFYLIVSSVYLMWTCYHPTLRSKYKMSATCFCDFYSGLCSSTHAKPQFPLNTNSFLLTPSLLCCVCTDELILSSSHIC